MIENYYDARQRDMEKMALHPQFLKRREQMSFYDEWLSLHQKEEIAWNKLCEISKIVQPKQAAFTNPTDQELIDYLDAAKTIEDIRKQIDELFQKHYG